MAPCATSSVLRTSPGVVTPPPPRAAHSNAESPFWWSNSSNLNLPSLNFPWHISRLCPLTLQAFKFNLVTRTAGRTESSGWNVSPSHTLRLSSQQWVCFVFQPFPAWGVPAKPKPALLQRFSRWERRCNILGGQKPLYLLLPTKWFPHELSCLFQDHLCFWIGPAMVQTLPEILRSPRQGHWPCFQNREALLKWGKSLCSFLRDWRLGLCFLQDSVQAPCHPM